MFARESPSVFNTHDHEATFGAVEIATCLRRVDAKLFVADASTAVAVGGAIEPSPAV